MIALVYDPAKVTDPEALGQSLGIGMLIAGIPPAYAYLCEFPPAGYFVGRETWAGLDVLPGPVTPEQIAALPDPGPDPQIAEVQARAQATSLLDILRAQPIDLPSLEANLGYLAAYLGDARVQSLPMDMTRMTALVDEIAAYYANATPDGAAAIAALKAEVELSTVAQRTALAVLADLIRYTLQRA